MQQMVLSSSSIRQKTVRVTCRYIYQNRRKISPYAYIYTCIYITYNNAKGRNACAQTLTESLWMTLKDDTEFSLLKLCAHCYIVDTLMIWFELHYLYVFQTVTYDAIIFSVVNVFRANRCHVQQRQNCTFYSIVTVWQVLNCKLTQSRNFISEKRCVDKVLDRYLYTLLQEIDPK